VILQSEICRFNTDKLRLIARQLLATDTLMPAVGVSSSSSASSSSLLLLLLLDTVM